MCCVGTNGRFGSGSQPRVSPPFSPVPSFIIRKFPTGSVRVDTVAPLLNHAIMTLEHIGVGLGLLYLFLEWRASIHLWWVGIIMPAIYAVVYFQSGIYGQFLLQLVFIGVSIYGWRKWLRDKQQGDKEVPTSEEPEISIMRIDPKTLQVFLTLALIPAVPLALLLKYLGGEAIPEVGLDNIALLDAYIAVLSLMAMAFLSAKIAEQWLLWCIADILTVVLYVTLSLKTNTDLWATAGLYAFYSIIAVFGYWKWRNMAIAAEQKNAEEKSAEKNPEHHSAAQNTEE